MTSRELISITANDVGDIGFEWLTKDEYLQFLNDSISEIGRKCGAFFEVEVINPISGESTITNVAQDIYKLVRLEYLIGGAKENPDEEVVYPCREISFSRIKDNLHGLDGTTHYYPQTQSKSYYDSNGDLSIIVDIESPLLTEYGDSWYATNLDNGLLTLHFGFRFKDTDQIRLWVLKTWSKHEIFDDTDIVWDQFKEVVLEGMRWRALRRLMSRPKILQNTMDYRGEWQLSYSNYYKILLPQTEQYIRHIKTTQDTLRMQPHRYL